MRVRGMKPFLAIAVLALAATARAQDDQAAELAKKLANPIASLTSVPLQYNYDKYGGTNDGASVSRLNIQPVIPFSLNEDWNLISRTIVPLVDQRDFPVAAMNESGLGDTTASLFFSPKAPTAGGWIWGGRTGPVAADGDPERAGRREVGPRADGRAFEANRAVDRRRAGQPYLVGGR